MITPTGPLAAGPFPAVLGVYRSLSFVAEHSEGRVKAEIGGNRPLQDVNGEHLELRAGSGLEPKNSIDVGVRDGAKNGPGVEKVPKMAGDVPVRYAPKSPGPGPVCSVEQEGAMKTTGHGIDDSGDVANVYHLRLMTILQELVRDKGHHGAARVLEVDQKTIAECARTGVLTRRVRQALERALQEGVGSAAARQRERNDRLEERLQVLEQDHEDLGKETRRRLAAVEGQVGSLPGNGAQGAGLAGTGPADSGQPEARVSSGAGGNPLPRREYPDLATLEPADDDEDVFGEAWELVKEWRALKDSHPNGGRGLAWLKDEERLLVLELALLEEHGLTLPPEQRPLRGFARSGQISWRRTALDDTRKAQARRKFFLRIKRRLTPGRWR